ncbi:response regulator [Pseudomonadota bacterium]
MKLSHQIMRVLIILLLGLIALSISLWLFVISPALKSSEQGKADMFMLANETGLGHVLEAKESVSIQTYIHQLMLLRDPNTSNYLLNGIEITMDSRAFSQIRPEAADNSFISETVIFSSDKNRRFLGSAKIYYSDRFYKKLQLQGNTALLSSILFFLFLLLTVFLFMERLLKPLTELTYHLLRLDTEVEYKLPPLEGENSEEISLVKNALDKLLSLLQRQREELEERVDERTAELNDARDRAETANRAKSEFLANMSHEIRTPLSAIVGITNLSLKEKLAPKVNEYMLTMRTASNSLLGIINDILDFSKIEAGKLELEYNPFDLSEVLKNLVGVFRESAREKNLELQLSISPDTPTLLNGDAARLSQVLINLVGNALKFTEKGKVSISTTLVEEDDSKAIIKFTVKDTGIGIEPENIDALFESFTQADSSTSRKYGGSGLGLSISQRLVNLMGGWINVQSRLGSGSSFAFSVEFMKKDPSSIQKHGERRPVPADFSLNDISVLLVEDNPINQKIIARTLEAEGLQVSVVSNGQEAIRLIQEESYDVVLMDMQMPVLSGIETTKILREEIGLTELPIIALTANAMKEDMDKCFEAGMNDFIVKPMNAESVKRLVFKWTADKKAP